MKTDNIYIGRLVYSTKIETEGTLRDYFVGEGIRDIVSYEHIKFIIVKKTNGYKTAIDLNTKKKYMFGIPTKIGVLFIPPEKTIPFELAFPEEKRNLSKKKILTLGKQAIKEFEKLYDEQKKK